MAENKHHIPIEMSQQEELSSESRPQFVSPETEHWVSAVAPAAIDDEGDQLQFGQAFEEDFPGSQDTLGNLPQLARHETRRSDRRLNSLSQTWSRILPGPLDPLRTEADMASEGIDYSFKDVSFSVKDKVLLEPLDGSFRGGEVVAIMGPSGSGKTTLLTMLAAKKTQGYTGEFLINGHPRDTSLFPKYTAYVPQSDLLEGQITVRECFRFYIKMKTRLSPQGVEDRIDWLAKNLQLESVLDSLIGDDQTRGISGGQKRRVSIGKGLISNPMIIFLDEPTSGLSATDAHTVVGCLRNIANQEKTLIMCVIHQPRYSVFQMFDELVLLSTGGKMAFNGPVRNLGMYFDRLGYMVPPNENAADYYLDIVTRGISSENDENVSNIVASYNEHIKGRTRAKVDRVKVGTNAAELITQLGATGTVSDINSRYNRGWYFQWKTIIRQATTLRMRNWPDIVRRLVTFCVAGALLGLIFLRGTYFIAGEALRYLAGIFTIMAFAGIFTLDQLPMLIEPKRAIYKSDRADAFYSTGAYFWGISVPMLVEGFILSALLATIQFWMVGYSSDIGVWIYFTFIVILMWWVTEGLMFLLAGVCANTAQANGLTVAVLAAFLVFCGFLVNTGASPDYLNWACYLSYFWYGWQALCYTVFKDWTLPADADLSEEFFQTNQEVFDTFGIDASLHYWSIVIILGWGMLFRGLAILSYRYLNAPSL
ncbi:hypothetical protein, variant [Sphaeroforma arctica JP610]|uniref:ABC transporter domain-containing protein n=1 Tax=Sphaeroforma arctica JP610 TaxID=667725 RepID=A0A0L0GDA1_9EUKA|nr:hypothetical protein, variant [Sphaeroforma arctica JP610]KNC86223.1 hypothetical protein, variant [Sphaeroforma arctica JP610]|eukprot:XP_014160125.1 hypothetical protein, variant [Sphaeroforma arctica JP610]